MEMRLRPPTFQPGFRKKSGFLLDGFGVCSPSQQPNRTWAGGASCRSFPIIQRSNGNPTTESDCPGDARSAPLFRTHSFPRCIHHRVVAVRAKAKMRLRSPPQEAPLWSAR
jgi:hypothetical protein